MQKDCRTWARACQPYRCSKVSRHTVTPVGNFTLPPACFFHVHIDLVGLLQSSAGFQYCLMVVDRFTRWPEAFPHCRHHSRNSVMCPALRLDITFWLPTDNHHRPGTPVRVTAFPQPGEAVWYTPHQDDPPPSHSQWPHGKATSHTEGRHRGASTRSNRLSSHGHQIHQLTNSRAD
jgi:hypothetical protein